MIGGICCFFEVIYCWRCFKKLSGILQLEDAIWIALSEVTMNSNLNHSRKCVGGRANVGLRSKAEWADSLYSTFFHQGCKRGSTVSSGGWEGSWEWVPGIAPSVPHFQKYHPLPRLETDYLIRSLPHFESETLAPSASNSGSTFIFRHFGAEMVPFDVVGLPRISILSQSIWNEN